VLGGCLHRTTRHDRSEHSETLDVEHVWIIQHHCMVRKKHSLVLNNWEGHHRGMNTNQNPSKIKRIGAFMRFVWEDQESAQRALLRLHGVRGLPAYDDYLMNRRGR
jgi:hypothetical protein